MINKEQIIETIAPAFIKGLVVIIIIALLQIMFSIWLKKFKKKLESKDSTYIQELKRKIHQLTNENKTLKKELKNV